MPEDLAAAFRKNSKAATEAKRAETRAKRLARTVEWSAEGKPRNRKYL